MADMTDMTTGWTNRACCIGGATRVCVCVCVCYHKSMSFFPSFPSSPASASASGLTCVNEVEDVNEVDV